MKLIVTHFHAKFKRYEADLSQDISFISSFHRLFQLLQNSVLHFERNVIFLKQNKKKTFFLRERREDL